MKKMYKTPLALAMGASLLPLSVNVAQAESNPFKVDELSSGYMQTAEAATPATPATDKAKAGSCGEGKCGAAMKMGASADKKVTEAKCAASKPSTPATPTPSPDKH